MAAPNTTLEQRIRRLEDIEEIQRLKHKYHTYINDTDFDKISALFTEDADVQMGYMSNGAPWLGRKQIHEAFSGMRDGERLSQLKQFLHNHIVNITGENTADGTALLEARYGREENSFMVAGKYIDDYERVDGQWLFKKMRVVFYFTVPLEQGWAKEKRHYLVNSGATIPDYKVLRPNPPI